VYNGELTPLAVNNLKNPQEERRDDLKEIARTLKALVDLGIKTYGKIAELETAVGEIKAASQTNLMSVREVADHFETSVKAVHNQLSTNPNLVPEKDWKKYNDRYYIFRSSLPKLPLGKQKRSQSKRTQSPAKGQK
jgi:acyl-CoA reductase-like NAD-dependent aldehyde dehydrogenase